MLYLRAPDGEMSGFRAQSGYDRFMGLPYPIDKDIFLALADHSRSERDLLKICYLHDFLFKNTRFLPSKQAKTIHVDGMDSGFRNVVATDGALKGSETQCNGCGVPSRAMCLSLTSLSCT